MLLRNKNWDGIKGAMSIYTPRCLDTPLLKGWESFEGGQEDNKYYFKAHHWRAWSSEDTDYLLQQLDGQNKDRVHYIGVAGGGEVFCYQVHENNKKSTTTTTVEDCERFKTVLVKKGSWLDESLMRCEWNNVRGALVDTAWKGEDWQGRCGTLNFQGR